MAQIVSGNLTRLLNSNLLRLSVLLSLFFQVVLIAMGSRRKYSRQKKVAMPVWLFYLSADVVATTALGYLSSNAKVRNDSREEIAIMALWAPFLLMHLGGPDTITAYALADNELWVRHALVLVGQVGVAFYVLIRSWTWTPVNYLWFGIFVAGLVKYGERTWVLFSASRDQFRESMVTPSDPGPNYAKLIEEVKYNEQEGYQVSIGKFDYNYTSSVIEQEGHQVSVGKFDNTVIFHPAADVGNNSLIKDARVLHQAYYFYKTFKKLFADLVLSIQDKEYSSAFFRSDVMDWKKAFSIVEIELGLIYDSLYTKALLIYSPWGFFFRLLTILCTLASLIAFVIIHVNLYPESKVLTAENVSLSLRTEVTITYVLLVGAVILEIYAVMILASSDMTMIWLSGTKLRYPIVYTIYKMVWLLRLLHIVPAKQRWSNVMGQYNFLDCCFESEPKSCARIRDYLDKKYFFWKRAPVPQGLKALIFSELQKGMYHDQNINKVEFDRSLLQWHLATDLCYYNDVGENHQVDKTLLRDHLNNEGEEVDEHKNLEYKREICKLLSDYMMHLLIMSPFMLPSGFGDMRFKDMRAQAIQFFDENKNVSRKDACQMLHIVDAQLEKYQMKEDRSKSVLFDACILANSLQSPDTGNQKWESITLAWVDMLTYAAAQCSYSVHAEKLGEGGELLTHVWLLMAHFGMTKHFQISMEHVRAKLVAK